MQDDTKPIRTFALIGLILRIAYTAMNIGIHLYPEPVLSMLGSPGDVTAAASAVRHPLVFVMPLLRLGFFLLLYYLLRTQIPAPTAFSGALLGLTLAANLVLYVLSVIAGHLANILISRLLGAAALGAYVSAEAVIGYIGIIDLLSYPFLLTAVGMNWYRYHTR